MKLIASEEIKPETEDLLFFVDDTGHETFAGNQGYYGLGGCAVLGATYADFKAKWAEVRAVINGNSSAPLHASTMERKPENFAALSGFFSDRSFLRIAVATTKEVGLPLDMHPCVAVMGQLREEIAVVASRLPCKVVMPKSSNEPGLEVADFVVSAAGSQIQRRLRGQSGQAPDFNDVFGRLPVEGCRYREVSNVTVHPDGLVSVNGLRLLLKDEV